MTKRLLIISNRLPISIIKEKNEIKYERSLGGLATGLDSFHKEEKSLWVGWPGIDTEDIEDQMDEIKKSLLDNYDCYPVYFTKEEKQKNYEGFCNKTVWPLFHYFTQFTTFDEELWRFYKKANQKFCEAIREIYQPDDIIWIQDYHLMLLPKLIRDIIPNASIAYFLHIPFPSYEIFRLLPWREKILEGLMGSDLIGFHTYDYERHFISSVNRILSHNFHLNQINYNGRNIKIDTFPMGIDYNSFSKKSNSKKVINMANEIRKEIGNVKIILSADRMDYTKGIKLRLEAFEQFLVKYPEYKEKVVMIFITAPSRSQVEEYQNLKREIDELVGRINGKFGKIEWTPILYRNKSIGFEELIALYQTSDIFLVTPIRDGMNLMAKEYIASKIDGNGVLILSETAGAAKQLFESEIINPNNQNQIVDAIKTAITMPDWEKKNKIDEMQKRIKNYDVEHWVKDILENLIQVKEAPLDLPTDYIDQKVKTQIFDAYLNAKNRLLIFDYDGTLVPFFNNPKDAKPDELIKKTLEGFSSDKKNKIVIISGREKETLSKWFDEMKIDIVAEHGLWKKEANNPWNNVDFINNDWKEDLRPILEKYVNRTPGSFIEEKDFCLAWHCRKVETELAEERQNELVNFLQNITLGEDLTILDGNKVVEIKNSIFNKGLALSNILNEKEFDFILVMGDDMTDEDMFELVESNDLAYSIKIGSSNTKAKYNLLTVDGSRRILTELLKFIKE